jgi:hypothetical protein
VRELASLHLATTSEQRDEIERAESEAAALREKLQASHDANDTARLQAMAAVGQLAAANALLVDAIPTNVCKAPWLTRRDEHFAACGFDPVKVAHLSGQPAARCTCTHEAGDSPCPVHRTCAGCGCPKERCDAIRPPAVKCCPDCDHGDGGQPAAPTRTEAESSDITTPDGAVDAYNAMGQHASTRTECEDELWCDSCEETMTSEDSDGNRAGICAKCWARTEAEQRVLEAMGRAGISTLLSHQQTPGWLGDACRAELARRRLK